MARGAAPDPNMKMYYIANARMPTEKAHGIQLAKMCEALREAGADVVLVAPRRGSDGRGMKEFYGLRIDIPLVVLPALAEYGASRIGFWASSFSFAISYFFYFSARRMRGERFFVYTTDLDQFSFFLIPFLGVPYFVEMHDAKKKTVPFRMLFARARGVIAVNRIIARKLVSTFGIPDQRVIAAPNGVDLSLFPLDKTKRAAREAVGLAQQEVVAMYVGRFYGWKGLETIVDVAAEPAFPAEVKIYFVGGTRQELIGATGRAHLHPRIVCVGSRDFREIPHWLAAADVLLLSGTKNNQYSYYHTSPMKLYEYMAAGRPIVACDTPAVRDMAAGASLCFYQPDDAASLALAVRDALQKGGYDETRARARAHDFLRAQRLTWRDRAQTILGFMNALV